MPVDKQFLVFNLGVFLLFSGVIGTLSLVSSLNVEDGLGTSSLAIAFGSSILSSFFVPVLIEQLGCRLFVFIVEIGYLIFILCNVYSSFNVIVGGFFFGIGEAGVWTVYPTIASRYAAKHSGVGSKKEETYRNHYIGYLFASAQTSVIFGNAAGFFILYIDRHVSNRLNATHQVNYSVCGSHDCQDGDITRANLEQYSPTYDTTRYIVIAVFSLFVLVAAGIHLIFLPNDNLSVLSEKLQSIQIDGDETIAETELVEKLTVGSHIEKEKENEEPKKISRFARLKSTVKSSIKLFFTPKHLLVVLLPLYNGLTIGYVLGELTRSYASCLLGLDKVAVGAMLFGTSDAILSYLSGKVAGKYGRNGPYLFAFMLDITNYVFSLYWIITDNNIWLVYVLFFSFGISDGIWQTLINVMYEEYFSVEREIAYNLWNVLVNIGTFIQFAISTQFCVYQKIYFQLAVLCCAMVTYSVSQIIYHRPSCNSAISTSQTRT